MSGPDRKTAKAQAEEVVRLLRSGKYVAPDGRTVVIREALARAVAGTREVPPTEPLPAGATGPHATTFEARDEGTLTAALRLADAADDVCALNFASAKHAGGGFLRGARAQEESLCRSSGLFACLDGRDMYRHAGTDGLYTSWMVHSPRVPVVRGDDGALLARPREVSFITCAAPNAKVVLERDPSRRGEVSAALAERVPRVLALAAARGHRALVLGAWGCGVFGCDPEEVARLFDEALRGPFRGAFAHVAFAVLDATPERRVLGPFARRFG